MASASDRASSGAASVPFSPSLIASVSPPTAVATTGLPAANAIGAMPDCVALR
jgi:hypothetical protein